MAVTVLSVEKRLNGNPILELARLYNPLRMDADDRSTADSTLESSTIARAGSMYAQVRNYFIFMATEPFLFI